MEVKRLTAQMVKHDAIIVDAHFKVRKVKIVDGHLRDALPIADSVIGDIADCTAEKSVSMLYVTLAADELLNRRLRGLARIPDVR